jgi:hypothetical protein
MTRSALFAWCVTVFLAMSVLAIPASEAAPPADTIKAVVDYYYEGSDEGPVLVDSKLCTEVQDLQCVGETDPATVAVGDTIMVWMQFFVPKDVTADDIMVEYAHEGVPRGLKPHKVDASIRYRVVDRYPLKKVGKWAIVIKKGTIPLKRFDIDVVER